jgi:hypothetical protein
MKDKLFFSPLVTLVCVLTRLISSSAAFVVPSPLFLRSFHHRRQPQASESSHPRPTSWLQPSIDTRCNHKNHYCSNGRVVRLGQTDSSSQQEEKSASAVVEHKKLELLHKIAELKQLQQQDGDIAIDFGVKGGELNQTTRAPSTLDYYSISNDVGTKADEILTVCDTLSTMSPTTHPTQYLGDKTNGQLAPLNGAWKLLFTNAADASFSKNSTRGDAKASNIVDAAKGTITNVIDFLPKLLDKDNNNTSTTKEEEEPVLKQLNVVIQAIPVSPQRVELQFKYVRAVLTKFLWFKLRWSLYIPVPGPFVTRLIVTLSRVTSFFRRSQSPTKSIPKAYFDILYLDKTLRIHKTGQGNLFVQARGDWEAAQSLLL